MLEINYAAIAVAAVAQFIVGGIWYMPLFGGLWGKIHGFETFSPEAQAEMKKGMLPLLVAQFLLGLLTAGVLGLFYASLPQDWNVFGMAGFFWLGFMLPTNVSAVLFGGTAPKWVTAKILVSAGGSLACMMAAATVFHLMA